MNKTLKTGLILGATALVLGGIIYFATRKTDEEPSAEGEEKSEEGKSDTSEEKKTSDSSSKPKVSRPKTTASKPSTTSTATKPTPTTTTPVKKPTTVNLKGSNVSGVISKTQNPAIYKGKVVISSKDKTILMGAKGNKLYELKKGTTVGKLVGSSLTKTGDYLITVQMNNGKSVLVNGNDLNFA